MRGALVALNRLIADKVIATYAIGGAVAAAFHIKPVATEDLDIFLPIVVNPGQLVSLTPIYAALKSYGGIVDGQYIDFDGWPVQILTDATPLVREAIQTALATVYEGVPTRVFTAEHLCAIALDVGRPKDLLRVVMFFDQSGVDREKLSAVLHRHGLTHKLDLLPVPNAELPPAPSRSR